MFYSIDISSSLCGDGGVWGRTDGRLGGKASWHHLIQSEQFCFLIGGSKMSPWVGLRGSNLFRKEC